LTGSNSGHGNGRNGKRHVMKKDIGVGVSAPGKSCEDEKCPWHGKLSVRGRTFGCVVVSTRSHLTAIVMRKYHQFVPKYQRYERRRSKLVAHNPSCIAAKEGDEVVVAECRPISKTKKFVVVSKKAGNGEPPMPDDKAAEKGTGKEAGKKGGGEK
jgi:small subunit ribosomal protein S17